jgi:hypothetical protein
MVHRRPNLWLSKEIYSKIAWFSKSPRHEVVAREETHSGEGREMIRLKVFGVALAAVFAASALGASAAQAVVVFNSEKENTTFTSTTATESVFVYEKALFVKCKKVTITNELNLKGTTTTTALLVKPTYDECVDENGNETNVNMNGCYYIYTLTGNNDLDGATDLECPLGQSITMKVTIPKGTLFCTWHIAPQKPGGVTEYENEGMETERSILLKHKLTGIVATRTGSAGCGLVESKVATFSGNVKLLGEKPGSSERVGIWVG